MILLFLFQGHSYEKSALEQWLKERNTSPWTNKELENSTSVINYNLRSTIEEFRRSQNAIDSKSNFRSFTLHRGRPQKSEWENKQKLRIIISLLGSTGVGKSYLAANAEYGLPLEDNKMRVTLALDISFFYLDRLFEDEYVVIIQINDCPGNDRFEAVSDRHFRNCHGAVLMVDTTSMETFERLEGYWYKRLREKSSFDSVETVLACNKIDLLEKGYDSSYRDEFFKRADAFASQYQMPICNISALRGDNVQAMFHQLILSILENPVLLKDLKENHMKSDKQTAAETPTIQLTSSPKTSKGNRCRC